jgi:N-acetylglucosaminyl-diphospho-decaprenol L-rhamnosyltransferase
VPEPDRAASITAVVVHYRGRDVLDRCLRSCLAEPLVAEVAVVDNSADADLAPDLATDGRVRLIRMPRNLGYGSAANVGLDAARTPAALVLNQDTVVPPGACGQLLDVARATGAWLVGPRLVDDDGTPAPPKRRHPRLSVWEPPPRSPAWSPSWQTVPWCSGAAVLFTPGHADLRFDRRFFMYVEDEELGGRTWDLGGSVVWAGDVTIVHSGGTATTRRWGPTTIARRILFGRIRLAGRLGPAAAMRFAFGEVWDRRPRIGR